MAFDSIAAEFQADAQKWRERAEEYGLEVARLTRTNEFLLQQQAELVALVESESKRADTERRRGQQWAIEALRPVLVEHFLFSLNCDHEAKTDTPWCGCAVVDLGTHPTVGDAVRAWVDHVMAVASSLVKGQES